MEDTTVVIMEAIMEDTMEDTMVDTGMGIKASTLMVTVVVTMVAGDMDEAMAATVVMDMDPSSHKRTYL